MVIVGSVKIPFFQSKHNSTMPSSQNINGRTVTPTIVNLESVLVDSDPEEDLEEIQHEAAAEQARIEEATRAKLAAAHEHIEKKHREWKAEEAQKAKEVRKAEEEEVWKRKEEEEWVAKEKAMEQSRRQQLKVSCYCSCFLVGTDFSLQMLKQKREAKKAWWVDVDGVSTRKTVFW